MTEILQKQSKAKKKRKKQTNKTLEGRIVYTRNKTWKLKSPEAFRKEL